MFLRLVYLAYRAYLFLVRPVTLGVRVLLVRDRQVLLVRHTYVNGWFLPGGGIKRGETPEQAVRREAHEEAGAELRHLTLRGIYSNFAEWKSDHNLVFLCRDFDFTGRHDAEIAQVRFFALDELPPGLWPGHRARLEEYRSGVQFPSFGEW